MQGAEYAAVRLGAQVLGALPPGLGQFRAAQWYWHRRHPPHKLMRQRLAGGPSLWLDIGDRTQALAYMTRRYDHATVRRLLAYLPHDGMFFDVGANVGLITCQVAHRRPDVRITAFEANPAAAKIWRRNAGLTGAVLVDAAVSAAPGTVSFAAPGHDLGAGRVVSDGFQVPAVTIDAYCAEHEIATIDVLKVDVEGSEPDVIAGAQGMLASGSIRVAQLEANDQLLVARGTSRGELIELMAARGFRTHGRTDEADILFVHARAGW
jgi:FkbM family methyltransferase